MRWMAIICIAVWGAGINAAAQEKSVEERLTELEQHMVRQTLQNEAILRLLTTTQVSSAPLQQGSSDATRSPVPLDDIKEETPQYSASRFTPGWVARIYNVPQKFDVASRIPDSEIGYFNADKSGYKAGDFQNILEIPI